VTQMRTCILLVALGILAAAVQVVATRWGIVGYLAGGLLSGVLIVAGMRVLALEIEKLYLPPLVAAAASLLGLLLGMAGSGVTYSRVVWAAPMLGALLPGLLALRIGLRGTKCQLCSMPLRRLLSFACPRCKLLACENCWQFERGRCRLCETNQIVLFPLDTTWWRKHFGPQIQGGRCAFCFRLSDERVAHWACAGCGHSQCRLCWDDNNGQCSRCGWTVPDLPADVSAYVAVGRRPRKTNA
jgi:hypothetical protein